MKGGEAGAGDRAWVDGPSQVSTGARTVDVGCHPRAGHFLHSATHLGVCQWVLYQLPYVVQDPLNAPEVVVTNSGGTGGGRGGLAGPLGPARGSRICGGT